MSRLNPPYSPPHIGAPLPSHDMDFKCHMSFVFLMVELMIINVLIFLKIKQIIRIPYLHYRYFLYIHVDIHQGDIYP